MKAMNRRSYLHQMIIGLFAFAILLGVGLVVGVRGYYHANLRPASQVGRSVTVTIPKGATLRETADKLQVEKVIKSAWAFERYVKNKDAADKIKAGTYELNPSYDVSQIVSIITEGKVATNLVTILPGQRLDQVKKGFLNAGYSQAEVEAAFEPSQYNNHPALTDKPASANLEGFLYPESFERSADTKPQLIIRKSLDEMQKRLTPDLRDTFAKQGLSIYKAVTLASMVEKEVSRSSDRPKVAQVFLKRLNSDMVLGSDVTAFYGAVIAGKEPSVLYDSPYNTRIHPGLPVGPISNVTESSLLAVAKPASTDWLYFVAGDDGNTYFSRTLSEHEALTAEYCKKLCQ